MASLRAASVLVAVGILSAAGAWRTMDSCAVRNAGPEYYAIDLVGTGNIPGMGLAVGRADVAPMASAPFTIAVGPDGSYEAELRIVLERMRPPRTGVLVAWVTTPELDEVARIGVLGDSLRVTGTTSWNKFLVVITHEPRNEPGAAWSGPVAFRGMSRSGAMHTMAGHGAFQQENCAAWGYR